MEAAPDHAGDDDGPAGPRRGQLIGAEQPDREVGDRPAVRGGVVQGCRGAGHSIPKFRRDAAVGDEQLAAGPDRHPAGQADGVRDVSDAPPVPGGRVGGGGVAAARGVVVRGAGSAELEQFAASPGQERAGAWAEPGGRQRRPAEMRQPAAVGPDVPWPPVPTGPGDPRDRPRTIGGSVNATAAITTTARTEPAARGGRAVTPYLIEVYWSDEDGAWIAVAPDLPHCTSHGPTPHEAVAEVEDAIAAWLEAAKSMGRDIPQPSLKAARA